MPIDFGQGPTQTNPDPQTMAQLLKMAGATPGIVPPPGGPIPSTAPVQPQGGNLAQLVSQVASLPQYQEPYNRLESIGQQEQDIRGQMQAMPIPQQGFHPNFVHGEGAGGFFHNLGQALLALGAATKPGQDVQNVVYGPGIKAYNAKQATLANQLAALKDEESVPTEELRGVSGLASAAGLANYRSGMLDIRQQTADIQKTKADAYVQSIKDRAANMVKSWDLRSAQLDEKKRHDLVAEAQQAADEAGRNYRAEHRDATTEEVAQVVSGTRTEIANEAAARDPSVKSWLFNALGVNVPQVQSAPSPEFRPTPQAQAPAAPAKPAAKPPAKAKAAGGAKEIHYDAQGNRVP